MKVVVCGPPHSGKSTFTGALIRAIRDRQWKQESHISFTWVPLDVTDNSLAAIINPDREIPQKRDVEWTTERAEERRAVFAGRDEQLVLADSPGLITDELHIVIEPADTMILLASREKNEKLDDWKEVAREANLDVFAELTTVLEEDFEPGWIDRSDRRGTLRSVDREDYEEQRLGSFDDTTRRMVKQLGTDLLKEAAANEG